MSPPFFSIIIPCYNVAPYVRECLTSVIKQAFRDFEAWVIVEASRDATEQVVRETVAGDTRFHVIVKPCSGSASIFHLFVYITYHML